MSDNLAAAFIKPTMRDKWQAADNQIRDTDFREYVHKVIADAMQATGGK